MIVLVKMKRKNRIREDDLSNSVLTLSETINISIKGHALLPDLSRN